MRADGEASVAATPVQLAEEVEPGDLPNSTSDADEAAEAADRVARSMELLEHYSEEKHPGHQPGRFAGPGLEYEGMVHDPITGRWSLAAPAEGGEQAKSTALAKLSEADQVLVTKFEAEGGLALTLGNAFRIPDRLRTAAREILKRFEGGGAGATAETGEGPEAEDFAELDAEVAKVLQNAGLGEATALLDQASPVERAILMFQAADLSEEREAVMRNVWSDVEFQAGDDGNAELVSRLEAQFANQLVRTTEVRISAREAAKRESPSSNEVRGATGSADHAGQADAAEAAVPDREEDGIFDIALRDCENVVQLAQKLPESELSATLLEPRNLGVALDLVGVYLKNYEIDKADLVISRVVPLCRKRGGTWLVKGLDKLSAVRMKQFRAYDALVALKEIEQVVPFRPEEGWEFYDILYRNLAWCYSALDEAKRCLDYTRKSVEVKRMSGVPASWFDIWDLGKGHARLGQKTGQRDEMQVAFDLCRKAAEIHRTAEPSDHIMLAKILSNVGEVAMGIGDSHHLANDDEQAMVWYEQAEAPLRESYELHYSALGPMKPLSGWAAGTVAHCLVRLERWEEARDYLAMSFKVECTKDSTTPGSVIELLDRVVAVQQKLDEPHGMDRYFADIDLGLAGLRERGWDRRERDIFALLLQKVSTAFLLGDDGTGKMIPKALKTLRDAETNLVIYHGATQGGKAFRCEHCGKLYPEQAELDAHVQRRHTGTPGGDDGIDVAPKRFGPQADPTELLQQVRQSIRLLELSERAGEQPFKEMRPEASGDAVFTTPRTVHIEEFVDAPEPLPDVDTGGQVPAPPSSAPDAAAGVLGVFQLRRMSAPFCTQLRYEPTYSREEHVFLPNLLVTDGESVSLLRVDDSGKFGYVRCRQGEEGWVQLKFLHRNAAPASATF